MHLLNVFSKQLKLLKNYLSPFTRRISLHLQLHSNNIDNDRIILLQQLCIRLNNKEDIIQRPTWLSGAQKKKKRHSV